MAEGWPKVVRPLPLAPCPPAPDSTEKLNRLFPLLTANTTLAPPLNVVFQGAGQEEGFDCLHFDLELSSWFSWQETLRVKYPLLGTKTTLSSNTDCPEPARPHPRLTPRQ